MVRHAIGCGRNRQIIDPAKFDQHQHRQLNFLNLDIKVMHSPGAADFDLLANGLGVLLPPFLVGFLELEFSLFEELLPEFFVFITSRISVQRYSKYNQLVKDKMHLLYVRSLFDRN